MVFSSDSPGAFCQLAIAKQPHAPAQRTNKKTTMRQKKGNKPSTARQRWGDAGAPGGGSLENESHPSFFTRFSHTCVPPRGALRLRPCLGIVLFVVIIRCVSFIPHAISSHHRLLNLPLATSSSVFCSSSSVPLRPPASLSGAAKWPDLYNTAGLGGLLSPGPLFLFPPPPLSISAPPCPPPPESFFLHSSAASAFGANGAPAGFRKKTHTWMTHVCYICSQQMSPQSP